MPTSRAHAPRSTLIRTVAAAAVAALGLMVLVQTAPAAAAEPEVTVTWGPPSLTLDDNGDGTPDVDDIVTSPIDYTVNAQGYTPVDLCRESGSTSVCSYLAPSVLAIGTHVTADHLDADGSGPHYDRVYVVLEEDATGDQIEVDVAAPAVYYEPAVTVDPPSIEVDETVGDTTDGAPAEGDRVRYSIDVYGFSDVDSITVTGDDSTDSVRYSTHDTYFSPWIDVTQQHMLDGEVPLPEIEVHWEDGQVNDSIVVQPGPVATEALLNAVENVEFELSFSKQDGTPLAPHEVEAGSRVDVSVTFDHTGNYTYGYVGLSFTGIDGLTSVGNNNASLAPGITADQGPWWDTTNGSGGEVNQAQVDAGVLEANIRLGVGPDIPGAETLVTEDVVVDLTAPAPVATVDVTGTFDDANADGVPSVGETATFHVTVENTGNAPLAGVTYTELGDATATALPSEQSIAPGDTVAWSAERVITAEDTATGAVNYGVEVQADGGISETAYAWVSGLPFVPVESGLTPGLEGEITLCDGDGNVVTEAEHGDEVTVVRSADGCSGPLPGSSTTVYAFSEPVILGAGDAPVALPESLPLGEHSIALYGPENTLLGWAALEIVAPAEPGGPEEAPEPAPEEVPEGDSEELAASGPGDSGMLLSAAGALIAAGVAVVGVTRRRLGEVSAGR
ncbi:DUF7507 domain-containing protein [Demequina sp. SO4-18]|uniref:DUF7507 domain-containing protein n=1 Tax=Demequina sp. SO4-18 TaxID=3401026 RepID=UPI003B5C4819